MTAVHCHHDSRCTIDRADEVIIIAVLHQSRMESAPNAQENTTGRGGTGNRLLQIDGRGDATSERQNKRPALTRRP